LMVRLGVAASKIKETAMIIGSFDARTLANMEVAALDDSLAVGRRLTRGHPQDALGSIRLPGWSYYQPVCWNPSRIPAF
jgi:hypothetical protein